MKKYLLLLTVIFITIYPIYVYAQGDKDLLSLNVQGAAKIKQNNVAVAREEAIQNALEKAILEAASRILSVPAKDENFQLIKNVLLSEPDKYVYNYKITDENRQPQTFSVNVNIVVAFLVLKNDLNKMGFINAPQMGKNNVKVFLSVNGLKKYSEYVRMKEFLQSRTKLVKNIYPIHFEWQRARFEVETYGDTQFLANELEQNGGCILEIKQVEHDKIDMICRQKMEEK
jgi:hypothetical protein